MSQTLFAVCLFAGVVALASAQSWDYQRCSRVVQQEMQRYQQTVMKEGQKFANSMQDSAGQAMDTTELQKNIDKMVQSINSLSNMEGGFDAGRVTSVYMENLQTMVEIGRSTWRPALVNGGISNYMGMMNGMTQAGMQFVQTVSSSCMPTNRGSQ